jgi:hypothetical protein
LFEKNPPSPLDYVGTVSLRAYWSDNVVVESVDVVVGAVVSGRSVVVIDVEELSGGVAEPDVASSSTAGVEVELTKGGAFTM